MKVDKSHMRDACPHIERAQRMLDMLRHFVDNKENLSLAKRVPVYYNILIDELLSIQDILLTEPEYTERVQRTLMKVSEDREFAYNVTQDKEGNNYYSIEAMLPAKRMKNKVLLGERHDV